MSGAFTVAETFETDTIKTKDVKLIEIPKNTIRFALSQNPFFYFDSLSHFFLALVRFPISLAAPTF